jgi:predicted acyl esterase
MPRIKYLDLKIRMAGRVLIEQVNDIIDEYNAAGYSLTLRQVYYQLVARGMIPNNERSYKNVGELVSNGRLAGLIDWYAIEDRTRYIRALPHWNEPAEIIAGAASQYRIDLWETQPRYVEVWVEKDALIGIVEQTAQQYDVPCFSCRGYTSQSEMWNAAQRIMRKSGQGERPCTIIHLGDHDPSGIDMTRDIRERLALFGAESCEMAINRIALNIDQINQYNPPPNPAKLTDTRAEKYIKEFGETSWELDALEPRKLDELVSRTIEQYIDADLMEKAKKRQREEKEKLDTAEEFVSHPENWQRKIVVGQEYGFFGGVV